MEERENRSAQEATSATVLSDEMIQLSRAWQEALGKPRHELRRFAGIVTNREKYRTRAVEYFQRFMLALSSGIAPSEARILAAEGHLWPLSKGCCTAEQRFFQRVLAGAVTLDECLALRTAFRIYWKLERNRIARANRAKFDPKTFYTERNLRFAEAAEMQRVKSLKRNRTIRPGH